MAKEVHMYNPSRFSRLAVRAALLLVASLTGCASSGSREQVVDTQKIDLVEHWAQRSGVTVIWVNQPRRAKPEPAELQPRNQ